VVRIARQLSASGLARTSGVEVQVCVPASGVARGQWPRCAHGCAVRRVHTVLTWWPYVRELASSPIRGCPEPEPEPEPEAEAEAEAELEPEPEAEPELEPEAKPSPGAPRPDATAAEGGLTRPGLS